MQHFFISLYLISHRRWASVRFNSLFNTKRKLRKANNIKSHLACSLQEVHIPRLITPAEKGRDLEPRVIDAYIIQCQAEAQEGEAAPHLHAAVKTCLCLLLKF